MPKKAHQPKRKTIKKSAANPVKTAFLKSTWLKRRGQELLNLRPNISSKEVKILEDLATRTLREGINPVDFLDNLIKLLKIKPELSTRDLVKYHMKFINWGKSGFYHEKVEGFLKALKEGKKVVFRKQIKKEKGDPTHLVYEGKHLYRNLNPEAVKAWKKLIDAEIPVEEMIAEKRISKRQKEAEKGKSNFDKNFPGWTERNFPNAKKGQIIVKTKPIGKTICAIYGKISREQALSIYRQTYKIILDTWTQGVIHGHMHPENFVVEFKKGTPKVRLIDFDMAKIVPQPNERNISNSIMQIEGNALASPAGFAAETLFQLAFQSGLNMSGRGNLLSPSTNFIQAALRKRFEAKKRKKK